MNKTVLILFLAFIPMSLYAQKAKHRSIGFKYYHLPSEPLLGAAKSFSITVSNTSTKVKVGNGRINKYLVLDGFERVEPQKADVLMQFSIYDVHTNASINSKEVEVKEDDKKVKKTKYFYHVSSETLAKFEMKYKTGQAIKLMSFNGSKYLFEAESGLFNTKKEAQDAFNKNKKALLQNADDSGLEKVLTDIRAFVFDHYAYQYSTVYESIATGKGKKHDYSDLDLALELYRNAAAEYGLKGVSSEFIRISNECIDIWKKAISEYDAGNKKARISRKNIDALYMNISIAYMYMTEFDTAIQAMEAALSVGKSDGYEKAQIRKIKERKKRYELNEKRKLTANTVLVANVTNTNPSGTTGMAAPAISLKGINPEYRIKRIVKKYHRGIDDYVDKMEYYYHGNRLSYIIKDTKQRIDSIAYDYNPRHINEQPYYYGKSGPKKWKTEQKYIRTYDITNGLVTKRTKLGEELIYKYNENGGLNALVRNKRDIGGYIMSKYKLTYQNDQLAKAQTFIFYQGDWTEHKDEALIFSNNGTVVNKLKGAKMYRAAMENGNIKKITKYKNFNESKEEFKYIYKYDPNGNIISQSFLNGYGDVETYEIEYEHKPGNEELFLATNDWPIFIYFHQLTFNEFFEVSY